MNDGDRYKVNPADQMDAAGFVDKAMSACRGDIDGMKSETDNMLAQWGEGATQNAFEMRQKQWLQSANDIVAILARFKASLGTSADISSSTELTNANTMGRG